MQPQLLQGFFFGVGGGGGGGGRGGSSSFVHIILKFVTTEVNVIIECHFLLATSIKL